MAIWLLLEAQVDLPNILAIVAESTGVMGPILIVLKIWGSNSGCEDDCEEEAVKCAESWGERTSACNSNRGV